MKRKSNIFLLASLIICNIPGIVLGLFISYLIYYKTKFFGATAIRPSDIGGLFVGIPGVFIGITTFFGAPILAKFSRFLESIFKRK